MSQRDGCSPREEICTQCGVLIQSTVNSSNFKVPTCYKVRYVLFKLKRSNEMRIFVISSVNFDAIKSADVFQLLLLRVSRAGEAGCFSPYTKLTLFYSTLVTLRM